MLELLSAEDKKTHQSVPLIPDNCDAKQLSREIGLEIASLCGRHFLKLNHLHYGYWPEELPLDISNLHIAQEYYTDFLVSHINENVETILDVGCGNGQNAKRLIDSGFDVDCLSPSRVLNQRARDLIGPESTIYQCCYEDLMTDKKYDLVLFSESFQYCKIEKAIQKTLSLLKDDGYMMICDIFKKDVESKCQVSGGHLFSAFDKAISQYPFELIEKIDITEETAANIDLENRLFKEVGLPAWNLLNQLMYSRHPFLTKLLRWKYKKKIAKLQNKYLSGSRTGQSFKKSKSYLLLVYKKSVNTKKQNDSFSNFCELSVSAV